MSKFEKIAEALAEQYVTVQMRKSAGIFPASENKERPGINIPMGLGSGIFGGMLESNVGPYGLTDAIQRRTHAAEVINSPFKFINSLNVSDVDKVKTKSGKEPGLNLIKAIILSRDDGTDESRKIVSDMFKEYYGKRGLTGKMSPDQVQNRLLKLVPLGREDLRDRLVAAGGITRGGKLQAGFGKMMEGLETPSAALRRQRIGRAGAVSGLAGSLLLPSLLDKLLRKRPPVDAPVDTQ